MIIVIMFASCSQKLDLSYNNLSPTDVLALGCLKKLCELDISSNNLAYLPADISTDVGSRCVTLICLCCYSVW